MLHSHGADKTLKIPGCSNDDNNKSAYTMQPILVKLNKICNRKSFHRFRKKRDGESSTTAEHSNPTEGAEEAGMSCSG